MTRLIIVRHAESTLNCENRIQGHKDSCLTGKGLRQARLLAGRIKNFKVDKIYSSDLGRAYATTREIARRIKLPIIQDPLLREINLGLWEGRTPDEVDKLYDRGYQRWLKKPSSIRIPEAEHIVHFRRRVVGRIKKIAAQNRGKTVLLVTHGGVITALLAYWLKADLDNLLLNLQIDNTSLTFVEESGKKARLRFINNISHLPEKENYEYHGHFKSHR